jgi:hypothetical protein
MIEFYCSAPKAFGVTNPQRLKDFQQARRNTQNVFSGEARGKKIFG